MRSKTFRKISSSLIRLVGGVIVRSIYRIKTVNPEHVPATGGALLLPNHTSFADGFFITSACARPVRFVMDETFMASRAIRIFVSIFETVTIRRDQPREAIRITIEALKNGDLVCLFPEGQLTRTGTLSELRRGFELIARKTNHPLIPLWCDGSWGTAFSFERGRFFGKFPRRNPVGMTLAFGPEIEPNNLDLGKVRHALLLASASAQTERFSNPNWGRRVPTGPTKAVKKFRLLSESARRRMWVNGYQIGQVNALQRRQPFHILRDDQTDMNLYGLLLTFPELFRATVIAHEKFQALPGSNWVGGDRLREKIATGPSVDGVAFYDFGTDALRAFEKTNVSHFPCLAVGGAVIAMSMPHPPKPAPDSEFQPGHKPSSWGKLLPGWHLLTSPGGDLCAHGPAAPEDGLPLPAPCVLDAEGFLGSS